MKYLENLKEFIYRKKYIKSWPLIETLAEAYYVINPQFICVDDYVFLDCGNEQNESEKIEIEALENHVHLFENVKKCLQEEVKLISISIAQNLLKWLKNQFPNKKFVVLLELNFKDSVIVRFHQIRDNEDLYMDPKYFSEQYANETFMMFK